MIIDIWGIKTTRRNDVRKQLYCYITDKTTIDKTGYIVRYKCDCEYCKEPDKIRQTHSEYIMSSPINNFDSIFCKGCITKLRYVKKSKSVFNEIRGVIESEGYKLLSTEYINAKENLRVCCPHRHIYNVNWNNWKSGKRCGECLKAQKPIDDKILCIGCWKEKSTSEFYKDCKSEYGYKSKCKDCEETNGNLSIRKRGYRRRSRRWEKSKKGIAFREKYKISRHMSSRIRESINNKNGTHWEELVDFTLEELKQHLESQFQPGMTWENQGDWHIDHIRPIASFDITSYEDEDFKKCWCLENLQPLWARDNLSKGAKWDEDN